jgi:hypothetical protein
MFLSPASRLPCALISLVSQNIFLLFIYDLQDFTRRTSLDLIFIQQSPVQEEAAEEDAPRENISHVNMSRSVLRLEFEYQLVLSNLCFYHSTGALFALVFVLETKDGQ